MLVASYTTSSRHIAAKENDSAILNIANGQKTLIYQYASEINQVLVGLATSNLDMALSKKKVADSTSKSFERQHNILTLRNQTDNNLLNENITIDQTNISLLTNTKIISSLEIAETEWLELKRIALLSIRSNAYEISNNRYVNQLLNQASITASKMDNTTRLMQNFSEQKLRQLDQIFLIMITFGAMLFSIILFYVYTRIIIPLDQSTISLNNANKKLLIERNEAIKANQAKSEFLSRMSHELRTPMNAILGFGQLLKSDSEKLSKEHQGNVTEILTAGYHLLNLINDVLDLARIESGKMQISLEHVSINEALQQCITMISQQAALRHIEISDNISSHNYTVRADFTRLKQVFLNLLSNAVKYNRDNGLITLDSEITRDRRLRILIRDTGEGMSQDNLSKLFTSFDRLDTKMHTEGTGIGLVITKHLVELMNGAIGVESTLREGSLFWIELELSSDNQ